MTNVVDHDKDENALRDACLRCVGLGAALHSLDKNAVHVPRQVNLWFNVNGWRDNGQANSDEEMTDVRFMAFVPGFDTRGIGTTPLEAVSALGRPLHKAASLVADAFMLALGIVRGFAMKNVDTQVSELTAFDRAAIENAARTAHEVNRAYCEGLGDRSQPEWQAAPEWQRSSAIEGVRGVIAGNTPEQSHQAWLAHKVLAGWKYGPVKDLRRKEHPCFVAYDKLPPAQRVKDTLFVTVVRGVLGIVEASR